MTDRRPYSSSKTVIILDFFLAALFFGISVRSYESYRYLATLINGHPIVFSAFDYLRNSRGPLAVASLCLLGALLEMRTARRAYFVNVVLPVALLLLSIVGLGRYYDTARASETEIVALLIVLPLFFISLLYCSIYWKRYRNSRKELT